MEYRQCWDEVLFLHWRVSPDTLRRYIPSPLVVATYGGQAWVSAVLFRLRARPHWLPFVPGVSRLVELNVRTYVHCRGRPGIWFLSVYADSHPAVWLARLLTPIPYEHRPLRYRPVGDGFEFQCRGGPPPILTFRPAGPVAEVASGSLDEWLLERYRLFARSGAVCLAEAEVIHPRWAVRAVEVSGVVAGVGQEVGLDLSRPPEAAHFSDGVRAVFGSFRQVAAVAPNQALQQTGAACRLSGVHSSPSGPGC